MDTEFSRSPLGTVQLIPIFNYMNLLSDFLFTKHYLTNVTLNQQIPIVNALYDYLEVHREGTSEKEELIRYLLQGSDLYGEQENENLEPIFVNAMFDYIISSLVFDKYGNIYGFLIDSLRKAEILQFDFLMKVIKANLQNAVFNNEFGASSTLTPFAVDRIYNDIILPLFPEPKTIRNVLSLDYIFAQAGSTYLRLGKINDIYYYPDLEDYTFIDMNEENLFDEYLALGFVIGNLLHRKKIDPLTLRVFALPALFHYIYTNVTVINETVTDIIFHPRHWEAAYHNFFEYVVNAFDQITNQLTKDYTYNLHLALLHFKNRAILAQLILTTECKFRNKEDEKNKIHSYIKNPENFECNKVVLPNVNDRFMKQIQNVGKLYGKYDVEITRQYFEESVKGDLNDIEIKLLVNDKMLANVFNNSQQLFYELLEFHFPKTEASDYFALVKENYTARLIKVTDNQKALQEKFGFSLDEFIRSANRTTLKHVDEGVNEFFENLMNYKKDRFENHLNTSDDNPTENKWWKEFGLSLVPTYPCLLNDRVTNCCETNNIEFLNKFQEDITAYITNGKTRLLLSSFGTTIKTVFVKNLIDRRVGKFVMSQNESFAVENTVYDRLALSIEKPESEALSITKGSINLAIMIIDDLRLRIDNQFTFIYRMLNDLKLLKSSFTRNVGSIIGEKEARILFVNTFNENSGYGYKFIFSDITNSKTRIAELRTVYNSKEKMLISLIQDSSDQGKTYMKVNNETLQFENNYFIYETSILSEKSIKRLFSGISTYDDNEECDTVDYLENVIISNHCRRYCRFTERTQNENEAIEITLNHYVAKGKNVSEEHIRNSLKKYILPDDKTFLFYFLKHLINDVNFENSEWSKNLMIDNPDLLNKLRYETRLENNNVSIADGERRISSIYTYRERSKIEEGTSMENITNDYNEQKASYSVTFEDYYAIRNFATTGDTRISGHTNEAKLMKLALYKLAIRQSDDPEHEFEFKLFRVECKPIGVIYNELYVGKHVTLQKFTLTSTNVESATRFSAPPISGFRNILYEMEFFGPYFRAKIVTKIDQLQPLKEKNVILVPGMKFIIKKITIVKIEGVGNVLKVALTIKSQSNDKYEWYKNIMREIKRIEL